MAGQRYRVSFTSIGPFTGNPKRTTRESEDLESIRDQVDGLRQLERGLMDDGRPVGPRDRVWDIVVEQSTLPPDWQWDWQPLDLAGDL